MSIFFEYKCDLQNGNAAVVESSWSSCERSMLAVANENGAISFFLEEVPNNMCFTPNRLNYFYMILYISILEHNIVQGERVEDATIMRGGKCGVLAWHPKLPLLASGWDDGIAK